MQRHGKYDPLPAHLKSLGIERTMMTFDKVEQVIESKLPASARKHRAWWSNNPSNGVVAYAWLAAGCKTKGVSIEHEFLAFRRDASVRQLLRSKPEDNVIETHPVLGCMSGTATVSAGTDLTKPNLPEGEARTMARDICHE